MDPGAAEEEKTVEKIARRTVKLLQDPVNATGKEAPGALIRKKSTHDAPRTRPTTTAGPKWADLSINHIGVVTKTSGIIVNRIII